MSDSTITTSGGLITQQFIENLQQPTFQHPGLRPETFALPGGKAPSPKELEENIGVTWELLKEKYDSVHDKLHGYDISELRSKWLVPLFMALDFDPEYQKSHLQIGQDEHLRFALSHKGWKGLHAPILHMVVPSQPLDERAGQQRGAKSPHDTLQQFLNLSQDYLWSVVTNGLVLRILRDYHHTYTKGLIEFDLDSLFYTRNYSDFRCLYRMLHASRFLPGEEGKTPLELFYDTSLTTGVAVGTDLRENVVQAIETMGNGFLEGEVASELQGDEKVTQEFYAEILHVIYRTLFLLFAEQKGLLGRRHSLYAEEYSITALRVQAEGDYSKEERHADLWERLKVTFQMVKLGVPEMDIFGYNGALFDEDKTALLNKITCRNGALLEAIRYLTCIEKDHVLTRISYADLGVEELGSIYESLLDYTPRIASDALTVDNRTVQPGTFFLDPRSAARKSSGSYYTSPKLVNELIRSALLPVTWQRLNDAGLPVRPQEEVGKDNLGLLKSYDLPLPQRQAGEKAILRLKIADPATGSGAFLIAADNALGLELARVRTGHDYPTEVESRKGRRDVLMHCLYGVDLNPMAVELAKVSLWINACLDNQPLNFLDHRIRCGNSLIGIPTRSQRLLTQSLVFKEKEELQLREEELNKQMGSLLKKGKRPTDPEVKALKKERDKVGREAERFVYTGWPDSIPDEAFGPVTGDDPEIAKAVKKRNKEEREGIRRLTDAETYQPTRALAKVAESIDSIKEQKGEDVEAKKKVFHQLTNSKEYLENRLLADLWTAAFLWPLDSENEETVPTTGLFEQCRNQPGCISAEVKEKIREIAERNRFFHWELEFPEVFEREESGFDVVLGNPPWEVMQPEEKKFFAGIDDSIAEASGDKRKRMISALVESNPELHSSWIEHVVLIERMNRHVRGSGKYPFCLTGKLNTYMVFSGQFEGLLAPRGRAGLIVPSGIATDDTTKEFFSHLTMDERLVSLFQFHNERFLFQAVHHSFRFCLMTIGGDSACVSNPDFAFFLFAVDELQDSWRHFTLSQKELMLLNPNTRTCPIFRSKRDAEINKSVYKRLPVFKNEALPGEEGNPWDIRFMQMINMTSDSHLFRTKEQLEQEGWKLSQDGNFEKDGKRCIRLYEAKMIHYFNHRFGDYRKKPEDSGANELPETSLASYQDSCFSVMPRYWIDEYLVLGLVSYAPPIALQALLWQSEDLALKALAYWIAGHKFHQGQEVEGGELLIKVTKAEFKSMVSALMDDLLAQGIGEKYPLTDEDFESIRRSSAALDGLERVVRNHTRKWFLAFRDIARSTDERTAIFSVIPWSGVGNNAPVILSEQPPSLLLQLATNLSSFAFDFIARQKVGGTHMNFFIANQLPVLTPSTFAVSGSTLLNPFSFITPRALELVFTASDLAPFARDCGYHGPPFQWDEERRFQLRCALDALFFHLYGVEREDTDYIMGTFPVVKRRDEARHGSYRTKEVILKYYDALAQGLSDLLPPVAPELKDWKPLQNK